MTRGRFVNIMDAKGRIAIPQGFRMAFQDPSRPPILTHCVGVPAVGIYTQERWEEIERNINGLDQLNPKVQRLRRLFLSGAQECPLDAQGRVRVPQHLRDSAGLSRQCLITRVGERIEIWDRTRFDQEIADGAGEVERFLSDQGLNL